MQTRQLDCINGPILKFDSGLSIYIYTVISSEQTLKTCSVARIGAHVTIACVRKYSYQTDVSTAVDEIPDNMNSSTVYWNY